MKKIVVGIDVSKKKIDASVLMAKKEEDSHTVSYIGQFENSPEGYRAMVREAKRASGSARPKEWLFCCETTGSYDLSLCEWLSGRGLSIWREHALTVRNSRGIVRLKTDKVDSRDIAEYAMRFRDRVRLYQPESPAMKELKVLFHHRRALVRDMAAWKTRSGEMRQTLRGFPEAAKVARECDKIVRSMQKAVDKCERRMAEIIAQDEALTRNFGHLVSIPGVGFVNAVGMLATTGNFTRFDSYRDFICYCGIAPFRKESGTSVHSRVDVSHLSNRTMKAYLSNAATAASKSPGPLRDYYLRLLSQGKEYSIAMNNLKAKIAKIMFFLVEKDTDFDPNYASRHAKHKNVKHTETAIYEPINENNRNFNKINFARL